MPPAIELLFARKRQRLQKQYKYFEKRNSQNNIYSLWGKKSDVTRRSKYSA